MATPARKTTGSSGKLVRMYSYHGNENDATNHLKIPPHPYLAPSTPEKRRIFEGQQYDIKCEAKSTLKDYLKKNPNIDIDYINKILIQVGYAVRHLHQHDHATNSKLRSEKIHFSGDGTHVFLARFKAERDNSSLKSFDLKMFGELISECLGEKCVSSEKMLQHLVDRIKSGGISTIEAVLQHPYFWSVEKRLSFLVKVFHIGKERPKLRQKLENEKDIFGPEGWFGKLNINVIDQRVKSSENANAIYDLLSIKQVKDGETVKDGKTVKDDKTVKDGKTIKNYSEKSVFSLLRFIRNVKTHFWDDSSKNETARKALSDDHKGLWKFFNDTFPSFFIDVYKCWLNHGGRENFIELKNMLDEMAPCRNLPSR